MRIFPHRPDFPYWVPIAVCLVHLTIPVFGGGRVVAWGGYYDLHMPETHRPMYVPPGLTNVISIAAGACHAVALKADGTVVAWGDSTNWKTSVPPGLSNVTAIACGMTHTLALKADGTVVGWGYSGAGAENIPPGLTNVIAIAAGTQLSLALRADGTVATWGRNLYGPATVPAGLSNVVGIAYGMGGSVAVGSDGSIVCWDYNGNVKELPTGLPNVTSISDRLVLGTDGAVRAYDSSGNCITNLPAGLTNVVAISAPDMALKQDGTLVVWGANEYGQTNVPANVSNVVAIASSHDFKLVLMGDGSPFVYPLPLRRVVADSSTIRLRTTALGSQPLGYQWSHNGSPLPGATGSELILQDIRLDQAGTYTLTVSNAFGLASASVQVEVQPLMIFMQPQSRSVLWGSSATLSVGAQGRAPLQYQWSLDGKDLVGATDNTLQLTDIHPAQTGAYRVSVTGSKASMQSEVATLSLTQVALWGGVPGSATALQPSGLTNLTSIAAASQHTLALRADGRVLAWGSRGVAGEINIPSGLSQVIAIAAGGSLSDDGESLALKRDGTVVAWGDSRYGQTTPPYNLSNVVAIAGGRHHFLALKADSTVAAWGMGYETGYRVPEDLMDVVAVAAGGRHDLALKADGTVTVFGGYGNAPTNVPANLSHVVAIAAGAQHSLALKADGSVMAWGDNSRGQTDVPAGLSNVIAVACGEYHSLALRADGTTAAWGDDYYGQTNVPTQLAKVAGLAAGGAHSLALVGAGPPVLGQALFPGVAAEGSTVWLGVRVSGEWPLSYQWSFQGRNLAGATNATLVLTDVQSSQAGFYCLTVSNAFGTATVSNVLELAPVVIRVPPQSQSAWRGSTVRLAVGATGKGPLRYQWQFNGMPLPGETERTLVLSDVTPDHAGQYTVVVSNDAGSATSVGAILSVPSVAVWGDSSNLQTVIPAGLERAVGVAGGGKQVLVLRADGTVVSWGQNGAGDPGIPLGASNIIAIAASGDEWGAFSALALKRDGTAVGWGNGPHVQGLLPTALTNLVAVASGVQHGLGLRSDGVVVAWGSGGQAAVPQGLTKVVAIAAGGFHSLALRSDGVVVGWGLDNSHQATAPSELTNAIAISAGALHSLALTRDGTVTAWGNNDYGQATPPAGLSNVVAIAAGGHHSMALTLAGTLVLCGQNYYGQLNVPPGLKNATAIAGGALTSIALLGDGGQLQTFRVTTCAQRTNRFTLSLPTQSGRVYRLEFKDSLATGEWTPLSLLPGDGGNLTISNSIDNSSLRFYRVRRW